MRQVVFEQLGDPEVEQLDLAVVGHEHVGRLEIPVHDEVGVRVRDGRQDVEEQADAGLDAKRPIVAVLVDVPAGDVLEHQVRLSGARDAGVDQPGNVGMREAGKDGPFPLEAFSAGASDQLGVEQLDRRLTFESAVVPRRQPHAAHAAAADRLHQGVGADARAFERHRAAQHAAAVVEEALGVEHPMLLEQGLEIVRDRGVVRPQRCQPRVAVGRGERQCVIEVRAQAMPAPAVECLQRNPPIT